MNLQQLVLVCSLVMTGYTFATQPNADPETGNPPISKGEKKLEEKDLPAEEAKNNNSSANTKVPKFRAGKAIKDAVK